MKLTQLILLLLVLIACSKKQAKLDNGLTRPVSKIVETNIRVSYDSNNMETLDTLTITEKYYDKENKIIKRLDSYVFLGDTMVIDFVYNKKKQLTKEIVNTPEGSITVNYHYKDSLLMKTHALSNNHGTKFEHTSVNAYDENNQLINTTMNHSSIQNESGDTTLNTSTIETYNSDRMLAKMSTTDYLQPEKNKTIVYSYKEGMVSKTQEYNSEDSLLHLTSFTYKMDKHNNWVEQLSYENNQLKTIRLRDIKYR